VGTTSTVIDEELSAWLAAQHMFFVATAPSGDGGHINCSPKGSDSFRVLGPTTIGYVDFTGSGVETIAHLRDNGRIVVMFCAFDGAPRIVRLHGRGEVLRPDHEQFAGLLQRFQQRSLGVRAIMRIEVTRVSNSCGYGVPILNFERERDTLASWAEKKGEAGVAKYWREKNARSLDDLPGVD
jgi:predicted pyridoxine 5'-phosphate oxidase superfamily flavin-nucleotide-binding protein